MVFATAKSEIRAISKNHRGVKGLKTGTKRALTLDYFLDQGGTAKAKEAATALDMNLNTVLSHLWYLRKHHNVFYEVKKGVATVRVLTPSQ